MAALTVLCFSSAAFAHGADAKATSAVKADAFKMVSVSDVAAWQKDKKVTVVDANNSETREKYGVIPGATLLTGSQYDAAKVLPANKAEKLVFYCANTKCTASHQAAERAVTAGYTDVNVLPDGIMGWKKAGQPVSSAPRS